MRNLKAIVAFVFTLAGSNAFAQQPEVFSTKDGAIGGYDPVAFFKESKPVPGMSRFTHSWNGATWNFSSKENLELFKASPEKYAPQFGGFCAYGTAQGHKSPTQPETWTILDGKLYFNYNMAVKKKWNEKQQELIEKANKNWPMLRKE